MKPARARIYIGGSLVGELSLIARDVRRNEDIAIRIVCDDGRVLWADRMLLRQAAPSSTSGELGIAVDPPHARLSIDDAEVSSA